MSIGRFTILSAFLIFLQPLGAKAEGLQKWQCVVEDFKGLDTTDESFIEKNLRKSFMLMVTKTEVISKMTSKDFDASEDRFFHFYSDSLYRHSRTESLVSLDTLSIPRDPESDVDKKGFFNAVISTQSAFYSNSWLLRCVE
jgi:hypothetical protein